MTTTIPFWALGLLFWFHLLATVTWVGSLVAISVLFQPAARRTLKPADQLAFIDAVQKRLEPVAWFSLSVLVVTGLFQMSVNPHYNGFLSLSNQWSIAMLIKHSLVVLMVVASAIHTWDVLPSLRRTLMKKDRATPEEIGGLQRRETFWLRTTLVLAILVLAATALARAS
jgi:uncharacterized membrane protein